METRPLSVLLMFFCSIFNALAFILLKKGSGSLAFPDLLLNYWLYLGLLSLFFGALFMIVALKGGNLSVLYPIMATTYIWMTILSIVFFQEKVFIYNWVGIFFIVLGVSLIGTSSPAIARKQKNVH